MRALIHALLVAGGLLACMDPESAGTEGRPDAAAPARDGAAPTAVARGRVWTPQRWAEGPDEVQVFSSFGSGRLGADATFQVLIAGNQGHLVMAGVVAADQLRPLWLAVARPGHEFELDARSTALALLVLLPGVATTDVEALAEIEGRLAPLPETAALAEYLHTEVGQVGAYLDEALSAAEAAALLEAAGRAAFTALLGEVPVVGTANLPLRIEPSGERSGVHFEPSGQHEVVAYNRGRRWVAVYASIDDGHAEQLVGLLETPPDTLSLETFRQGTPLTAVEQHIVLPAVERVTLRAYGVGLAPADISCLPPPPGDWRLTIPTTATFVTNFLAPTLSLVVGLNFTNGAGGLRSVAENFFARTLFLFFSEDVEIGLGGMGRSCALGLAENDWRAVGSCFLQAASKALVASFVQVALGAGDQWFGHGRSALRMPILTHALGRMLVGHSPGDLEFVQVADHSFLRQMFIAAGLGAVQIAVQEVTLALRLVQIASSAIDLGLSFGTFIASRNAECFEVLADQVVEGACVDHDGDGFGARDATGAVGDCPNPQADCDDSRADAFPGAPELCNGVDDNCNGHVDEEGVCPPGCDPLCRERTCGPNGCGGECGGCPGGYECEEGQCICHPDCNARICGSDGCGGSCGACPPGFQCAGGECACAPNCDGRRCGDDGCGGSCGDCGPAGGGGGGEPNSLEGRRCPAIGEQTCHRERRYICLSTGWSGSNTCTDSRVPGCHCVVYADRAGRNHVALCVDPAEQQICN